MKLRNLAWGSFTMLLIGAASPALAHHGGHSHVQFGFYVGAPVWGAWDYPYYYPPYPYYARVVMTSPPPPSDVMPAPGPGGPTQQPYYRNYCSNPAGYYPRVAECPGSWQLR